MTESASGLQLAVLGSPIAHSLSPSLHRAAYDRLGLDWSYDAQEVAGDELESFVRSRESQWRGLSLTMPLKEQVLPLLDTMDEVAKLTQAANTVLFDWLDPSDTGAPRLRGFNTDVPGLVGALAEHGVTTASSVTILGGGATARSALVAAAELGAQAVRVVIRDPSRATALRNLAREVGMAVTVAALPDVDQGTTLEAPGLTISTLPGDVLAEATVRRFHVDHGSVLFDVAYHPWPSALAVHWRACGGEALSGLDMLIHQALLQVRVFTIGDPLRHLPDEENILRSMREAVDHAR